MTSRSNHRIIVGVDYGTTYSGASYVGTDGDNLKDIVVISSWPGATRDADSVLKTPSRIAYPSENSKIGQKRWGFQVQPGMTAYSWTKLLLDRDTPITKYDDPALEEASSMGILKLPEGKVAVDVASDFLSGVYEFILKTIARRITEQTLEITPLEFWFTIPAIWSDKAQDATREAALRAGFGQRPQDRIFLITEPEAAAIAALTKSKTDGMGVSVKPGDGVLVCDCGGGTVDITTYLINEVSPTLIFEELCTGIGGKCGSTAIDRNFYQLMSERFGSAFDDLPQRRKGPGSNFMMKFERIKGDFGHLAEEEIHELPLNMTLDEPNPEFFDEDEQMVLISDNDLRQLFDPVVDQVLSLVRQQIEDANAEAGNDAINRIILVGGFGDSEYLRRSFKEAFESKEIMVTIPDSPQAAIVQGAALRGLEGTYSRTRRCRRHYGFVWGIDFREGIDDEKNMYIHKTTGKKMVSGIMKWMIHKGEKYSESHSTQAYIAKTHYPEDSLIHTKPLYSCDVAMAPERVESEYVRKVGCIVMDFTDTNIEPWETKDIYGKKVYQLEYSLKVIFGAQEGVLKFECYSSGKVIGKASINFANNKYY